MTTYRTNDAGEDIPLPNQDPVQEALDRNTREQVDIALNPCNEMLEVIRQLLQDRRVLTEEVLQLCAKYEKQCPSCKQYFRGRSGHGKILAVIGELGEEGTLYPEVCSKECESAYRK